MGLNHIYIPGLAAGNLADKGVSSFNPNKLAVHYLKPFDDEDYCHEERKWPATHRYNQTIIMGCGSVAQRGPFHDTVKNHKHADSFDMYEYFEKHSGDVEIGKVGVNTWVTALVTLRNSPEHLVTDPITQITRSDSFDHKLQVKEILSSEGFSKDPVLAQQENPSKLPPTKPDADGNYKGDKVYKIVIPHIVNLYGYEKSAHSKKHDVTKVWADFTRADCSPPGKQQKSN